MRQILLALTIASILCGCVHPPDPRYHRDVISCPPLPPLEMSDIAGVWAGRFHATDSHSFLYLDLNLDSTGLIALYSKDSPDSPELLIQNYDCTWSLDYRTIDIVPDEGGFILSGYASRSQLQLKWCDDTHEHTYHLHRRPEYMDVLKEIENSLAFPSATVEIAYIVEEGDDIYTVAIKFGVVATTLRFHNNLTSSELTPGQTIIIPLPQ